MSEVYPTTFIYALCDPRTETLRYVGKSNSPVRRLERHLREARTLRSCHRHDWLASLLAAGVKPSLCILEECAASVWAEREQFWIAFHRAAGCDLVNNSDGGEGNEGYVFSPESRARMSAARKGRPKPEGFGTKISAANSGQKLTPEQAERQREAQQAKVITPEHRARMTQGRIGMKMSAECLAKRFNARAKEYILTSPDGVEHHIKGLAKFSRENDLSYSNLCGVLAGRHAHHKGWRIRRPDDTPAE